MSHLRALKRSGERSGERSTALLRAKDRTEKAKKRPWLVKVCTSQETRLLILLDPHSTVNALKGVRSTVKYFREHSSVIVCLHQSQFSFAGAAGTHENCNGANASFTKDEHAYSALIRWISAPTSCPCFAGCIETEHLASFPEHGPVRCLRLSLLEWDGGEELSYAIDGRYILQGVPTTKICPMHLVLGVLSLLDEMHGEFSSFLLITSRSKLSLNHTACSSHSSMC